MKIRTPFTQPEPFDLDQVLDVLGAVEIDPSMVPDHWTTPLPPGQQYAIFLEGRNAERPDWSRREARSLAEHCHKHRAWLQHHRTVASKRGLPSPVAMPRWHGVAVCPRCHELQIVQSNATKNDLCWACQGRCRVKHRPNVRACDECRSQMQVLWTTDQDIPRDWA